MERKKKPLHLKIEFGASIGLITISMVVALIFLIISNERELSSLENILFQLFTLSFGLFGSFLFGKISARDAGREIVKPLARSAFRRLISLYQSLSRMAFIIENKKNSKDKIHNNETQILAVIEAIVVEQISTADDAMEDWYDIVPDDVEELKQKLIGEKRNEFY